MRSRRLPALPPVGTSDRGEGSSAAAVGERAAPPTCRSLFEDKASVSDITIAPFPRRAPPVKSFVAVPNKSLVQVVPFEAATRGEVRAAGRKRY